MLDSVYLHSILIDYLNKNMKIKTRINVTVSLLFLGIIQNGVTLATTDTWLANDDGTVTDVATGLIWQQQDDDVTRNHANAVTYCQGLTLANTSNWRLPNVKELSSIIDYRVERPAIDRVTFPNSNSARYWSATNNPNSLSFSWYVDFFRGFIISTNNTDLNLVRCVR